MKFPVKLTKGKFRSSKSKEATFKLSTKYEYIAVNFMVKLFGMEASPVGGNQSEVLFRALYVLSPSPLF